MSSIITQTDRLIIREFNLLDAPFILTLLNTPSWIKFIGDRGVKTILDAENYLAKGPLTSYQKNGFGLYCVTLKSSGVPVGMCGLIKRDSLEHVDIGFALLPEYEGLGYGYEMASATFEYGKKVLKLSDIVAITATDNIHSIQLLKKIGLQFEKNIMLPGEETELLYFSEKHPV